MSDDQRDNDVIVAAVRHIEPNRERRSIRIELTTATEPLVLRMPLEAAEALLPFLVKAVADVRQQASGPPTMFTIKSGSVGSLSDGSVLFDFELPGGAHFPLRMEPLAVVPLLDSLNQALVLGDQNRAKKKT